MKYNVRYLKGSWGRYLGMTAAMTQDLSPLAVPTASAKKSLSEHKNNKITKIH